MDQGTNCPLVDPTPPPPKEKRRSTSGASQRRSWARKPPVESHLGRDPIGHRPFFGPLSEDPDCTTPVIDIVDVETAELADPDSGRIQQFEDGDISWAYWIITLGGLRGSGVEEVDDLAGPQHLRKRLMRLRARQAGTGVAISSAAAFYPTGESAGGGGLTGDGAARVAGGLLERKPTA
jgi:hypothetical protein